MADTINIILDYLRKNNFCRAEDALRAELSTRENSNGAISLQLNDVDVTTLFQSLQDRASRQQGNVSSDTERQGFILEKARIPHPDNSELNSARDKIDEAQRWSTSEPEKSVFVDFGVHKAGSQQGKSAFLHAVGVDRIASEDLSGVLSSKEPVLQQDKHFSELPRVSEGRPLLEDEQSVQDRKAEILPPQVAGDNVLVSTNDDAEDAVFEEGKVVGPFQLDSPQWFGSKSQGRFGAQHQLKIAPRDVTLRPPVKRPVSQQEKRKPHTKRDKGVSSQPDSGAQMQEKLTFNTTGKVEALNEGRLPFDERVELSQVLPEDVDSVYYGRGAGELSKNLSTDRGVAVKDQDVKSSWKDVPIKTGFPFPLVDPSLKGEPLLIRGPKVQVGFSDTAREGNSKVLDGMTATPDVKVATERAGGEGEQVKLFDNDARGCQEAGKELPNLPPVRLRSGDHKNLDSGKEGLTGPGFRSGVESSMPGTVGVSSEAVFGLGSFLDIPVGQDVSSSGTRRLSGGSRPSVSQGIVEDASERLSGFAIAGDAQSESIVEYPDGYWDSDMYDDDDDPGYHRQPIEDGEWFLAHEIDFPDEKSSGGLDSISSHHDKEYGKLEEDDRSFLEEESYFSGEEYYRGKRGERRDSQAEMEHLSNIDLYKRVEESQLGALRRQTGGQTRGPSLYEGTLLDGDLQLRHTGPMWKGFAAAEDEGDDKLLLERAGAEDVGSVRSAGVGISISSDVAEFGSEVRDSLVGGSSEGGDLDSIRDRERGSHGSLSSRDARKNSSSKTRFDDVEPTQEVLKNGNGQEGEDEEPDHEVILRYYNEAWSQKRGMVDRQNSDGERLYEQDNGATKGNGNTENHFHEEQEIGGFGFGGFSFPSPSSGGDVAVMSRADSGKSLWSVRDVVTGRGEDGDEYANGIIGPDDTLAVWKRKSNESSPIISPRNDMLRNLALSSGSTVSAHSTDDYGSGEVKERDEELEVNHHNEDESEAVAADDEEAAAVQEQIRRIRAEEDEFETFSLKIIHRKNRTGFEEDKDFPVVINSVIAGRYHVTEYLGSAAFSQAIQAHDLHTGMDVCMKIIKNNKDFFDQSLDEIKLLKYINKNDPGDKHHVLRLYDYFYHREHLFIVCELLRANLYEFHKYNRESGGEVYFTMPRLQSITRQCLEALEFIHGLGLIHCDLKPENILVKSYSRCEVKVIDLGSSCFQTDHLCSYVQSRSYRAPEVILGLPYNQKIDMWSLGCILSELCSGNVLFQNDSLATLLARVVGILGPIDPEMLAKGRDTHNFFTKNHMIYERNKDTNQLEYLLPKKTSLSHRLPMGDQGFVDFVGYLLQINPASRPTAQDALRHPWLSFPYEPISS